MNTSVEGKSDLDKFIDLYKSLGVDIKVNTVDDNKRGEKMFVMLCSDDYYKDECKITQSEKFYGYSRFYSDLVFDKDGKFMSQGFGE